MAKRAKKTEEPKMMMWSWHSMCNCGHGGFLARLLFAGTLVCILNMLGIITNVVPIWMQVVLVIAYAFMKKGHCCCNNNCCK